MFFVFLILFFWVYGFSGCLILGFLFCFSIGLYFVVYLQAVWLSLMSCSLAYFICIFMLMLGCFNSGFIVVLFFAQFFWFIGFFVCVALYIYVYVYIVGIFIFMLFFSNSGVFWSAMVPESLVACLVPPGHVHFYSGWWVFLNCLNSDYVFMGSFALLCFSNFV